MIFLVLGDSCTLKGERKCIESTDDLHKVDLHAYLLNNMIWRIHKNEFTIVAYNYQGQCGNLD